jgi:hypothetical protein
MAGLRSRPLAWVAILTAALLVTLVPAPEAARADSGLEAEFVAAVNRERAAAGLPALAVAGDLTTVARRHSARMADQSHLHHNPSLGSDVSGWQKVGENVGQGPSVSSIHGAFMGSPGHERNILDGDWTQIGIGVEVRGSTVWVTEVFRLPAGAAPKPKPEPEPARTEPARTEPATSEPANTRAVPAASTSAPKAAPAPSSPASSSDAGDPEPAAAAAAADAAPVAPAEPEPYALADTPLPLDRMVVTLARLEANEGGVRLDEVLDDVES